MSNPERPNWLEDVISGRLANDDTGSPNGTGGGGGGDMTELTRRVGDLEKRVDRVEGKIDLLSQDVAEIKGKLSQMPTTFQMLTWFVGVSIALTALVFTIARMTAS